MIQGRGALSTYTALMPNLQALFVWIRDTPTTVPTPYEVYQWTQTWWFTSTVFFVVLLWGIELLHRGWTRDRGDARPTLLVLLSTASLAWMIRTVWLGGYWYDFGPLWATVNGPVLRLCVVRYLYGSLRNTTAAAARTMHLWMIIGLIRLSTFTVGETTLARRQRATYVGIPVDDFNFIPVLHMVWIFELCDLGVSLYSARAVGAIQDEMVRSIRQHRPPRLAWYGWWHWLLAWSWLTVRVVGLAALTLVSNWAVSGKVARVYFGLIVMGQLSLWWDLRNLSPARIQQKWARYTQRYAERNEYDKKMR